MKQIDRAKISLEKTEEQLNRFAKQAGIVSLDAKLNSIYRQLEELNSSLAAAESESDWQEGCLPAGSQRRVFLSAPGTGKPGDR